MPLSHQTNERATLRLVGGGSRHIQEIVTEASSHASSGASGIQSSHINGNATPELTTLLARLERAVRADFPRVDPHYLSQSAEDAILEYLIRESHGNDSPFHTFAFLRLVAWRKVAKQLRGDRRRRHYEERAAQLQPSHEPIAGLGQILGIKVYRQAYRLLDRKDRRVLTLMLRNERATSMFANVLGISSMALRDRRRLVKRAKDRVIKRLRRHLCKAELARAR